MFMTAFGWADVGTIAAVRLGYVCAGAALARGSQCLLFPTGVGRHPAATQKIYGYHKNCWLRYAAGRRWTPSFITAW